MALTVPGPRAPAVAQAVRLGAAPYGHLEACWRQYGDLFTLRLPRDPVRVIACHPEHVKAIFDLPPSAIAPAVARHLVQPMQLGEHEIPAGTIVWPCIYLVQRHPDVWDDPETFRPLRWLDGARVPSSHYFPWGCLGMAFATSELRIVVARILVFRALSIGASEGVRVRVRQVRGARSALGSGDMAVV